MEIELKTEINESLSEIEKKIHAELQKQVKKRLKTLSNKLKEKISIELYQALSSQPEWQSIQSGILRSELGVVDGSSALFKILDTLLQSINVDIDYRQSPEIFNIKIEAVNQDYNDLYNLPESSFISRNGSLIEWLKWLLEGGDGVIVIGYQVEYGNYGRTGEAHMIPGNGWKVPSQFAGYKGNNFITRAIEQASTKIENILRDSINEL